MDINEILIALKQAGYTITKDQDINHSWTDELTTNKQGYENTVHNYVLWLKNVYKNRIKFNKCFNIIELDGKVIEDNNISKLIYECESFFGHNVYRANFNTAFDVYVHENEYNPIINFLNSLHGKWDGVKRIEKLFIDCLDADDNDINKYFSKQWMIGCVKRAFEPAAQFDNILLLQGGIQGSGKTNVFRCLFGRDGGLENDLYQIFGQGEFNTKDAIGKMNQSWCVLLDEFDKFDDTEVAELKSKITETKMSYRPAYGHYTINVDVHWCYAATLNDDTFLSDLTGDGFERRYWIIECHKNTVDGRVKDILTPEYVKQIWAEALYYYFEDTNQKLFLDSSNPLFEPYKQYQMKFKKISQSPAIDYLDELLNKTKYSTVNGCFADSQDMLKQFTGQKECVKDSYITRVPCSYVRLLLEKVFNIKYKPKGISNVLKYVNGNWTLKHAEYNGKVQSNVLCKTTL